MNRRISTLLAAVVFVGAGLAVVSAQTPPAAPAAQDAASQKEGRGWGHGMGGFWAKMTPEDRAALMQARVTGRLAEAKALLKLTPDQEKLWTPLESAIRDQASAGAARMTAMMEKMKAREAKPADPIERLQFAAEAASQRADGLKKILAAAQPFYSSLSDEQKKHVGTIMHFGHRMGGFGGFGERHGHPGMMGRFGGEE